VGGCSRAVCAALRRLLLARSATPLQASNDPPNPPTTPSNPGSPPPPAGPPTTLAAATALADSSEPRYCICQNVSYGEMIACDNPDCIVEWFHYECVGITQQPKGKWYCPQCRAAGCGAG
jgi:hypothetical protein